MKDRDRFGAELRLLRLPLEGELSEPEGETPKPAPPRKIILAAGLDYPRYDKEDAARPKNWVLRGGRTIPLTLTNGFDGKLDKPRCLTAADRKLKAGRDILTGSNWRLRCLRLATQRLRADPDAQVYLYDFQKGLEERITIDGGKLVAQKIRTFLPIVNSDYRRVVEIKEKDPKTGKETTKRVLRRVKNETIRIASHPHRPAIRYFPFVTTLGAGDVDHETWLTTIAANDTWLDKYRKLPEAGRLLSITDVYYHVQFIGRKVPSALHELHLFGHASSSALSENSGTAFVNTDHVAIKGRAGRHPLDLDARATLDFGAPTIDAKLFRKAFAKEAMSYVWGCNWNRPLKDIIRQAANSLGANPLKDDTRIKFRWEDEGTSGPKDDFK